MKKHIKKELISYGIMALVAGLLYITGLHVQVISYLQRGLLATGLIRPNIEAATERTAAAFPEVDLDIELMDAAGEVVNMQQFRGKVLFVNVWATWCPPCLAEMPNIDQLYRDLESEEIVFIMLSVDHDFSKAIAHVNSKRFRFPVYQLKGRWPAVLDASTIPTTFVIDKAGRVVLENSGMANYNSKSFKAFLRETMEKESDFGPS